MMDERVNGIENGWKHAVLLDQRWGVLCLRQGHDTQPVRNCNDTVSESQHAPLA